MGLILGWGSLQLCQSLVNELYKVLGHVGPLGKNLNFLSPLGSLKFYVFLSFLFILKLSYSKPIRKILNYASTANIEELTKFYNLCDKTFETDFSCCAVFKFFFTSYFLCKLKPNFCKPQTGLPGGSLPRNAWYGGAARMGPYF